MNSYKVIKLGDKSYTDYIFVIEYNNDTCNLVMPDTNDYISFETRNMLGIVVYPVTSTGIKDTFVTTRSKPKILVEFDFAALEYRKQKLVFSQIELCIWLTWISNKEPYASDKGKKRQETGISYFSKVGKPIHLSPDSILGGEVIYIG